MADGADDKYDALRQVLFEVRGAFGIDGRGDDPRSSVPCQLLQAPGALSAEALAELDAVMLEPQARRDARRGAELCRPLQFFRRLAPWQCEQLLGTGQMMRLVAGEQVYRFGDPLGHVFIVLSGSVTIQQACNDSRGARAFVQTLFDGKAFGDGWNPGEEHGLAAGSRCSCAIAQEATRLLRLPTQPYLRITAPDAHGSALLRELNFLAPCTLQHVAVLASLLEPRLARHGEVLVEVGERVRACHVVGAGICTLRVRTSLDEMGRSLVAQELASGACFGHGALLDAEGVCAYPARASIFVESWTLELHLLRRSSLEETLPDATFDQVMAQLGARQVEDPLNDDGRAAIAQEARWRRQKSRILDEERRCSAAVCLGGTRAKSISSLRQQAKHPRPQTAAVGSRRGSLARSSSCRGGFGSTRVSAEGGGRAGMLKLMASFS